MENSNCFKEFFESISDKRKIVLLIFSIQSKKNLLTEIGFNKNNINRLNLEFKNILIEQHEEHLDYVRTEEKSVIEKFLNK